MYIRLSLKKTQSLAVRYFLIFFKFNIKRKNLIVLKMITKNLISILFQKEVDLRRTQGKEQLKLK